jgi:TRAP-type mannitol/chloroaromatic compound transport system permease small subunit
LTVLLALSTAIDRVNEFIGKQVSWLILVAVLISAGNAIVRKAFNTSSNAWLEAQWYLFGAVFMLAAAYTLKQNEHIRIDIFYGARKKRTQDWIDLFGHIFFLLPLCLLMTWLLVPKAWHLFKSGEVSSNPGGLVLWPSMFVIMAGFILLLLQCLSEIIKRIAVIRSIIDDPNPHMPAHAPLDITPLVKSAEHD